MKKYLHNLIAWKLKILVKWLLKKNHPLVIGITGSIAKTSTKEAIYEVLSWRFENKVRKSEGNLNTEIGLPLAVLGFKNRPKWYGWPIVLLMAGLRVFIPQLNPLAQTSILILEYAADKPGDIQYLTSFIRPDIAIITIIGPAHLENYISLDQVEEEKAQLVYALEKHGIALLNKKDPSSKRILKKIKGEVKFFSADLNNIVPEVAKKMAEIFDINQQSVTKILSQMKPLPHRMNTIKNQDLVIIDDTYNANPLSMRFALEKLKTENLRLKTKRKIAVLGTMLELGKESQKYHQEIGQLAKKTADLVIGIGELAKDYQPHYWFKDKTQAEVFLLKEIKKGDIILFKASRGMRVEKLVEEIINR